jgi:hypothetical protein
MRKILLTTTALVALGGVSAASADISISGSASYNYTTGTGGSFTADDSGMSTQVDFGISGSTTMDNGMTASGGIDLDEGGLDDSGWTLAGDWGTLKFGGYAEAAFGAMSIDVTADEGNGFEKAGAAFAAGEYGAFLPGDEYIDHADISLTLPTVSGVTVMLGAADTNDASMAGVSYAMDAGGIGVTVAYAQSSSSAANSDDSQLAAKVAAGNATVTVISGASGLYNNSGVGVTYAVSDALTIQAYSGTTDHDTTAAYEVKDTGIGLTYTVTPGMSISLTSNDYSGKGGDSPAGTTTDVSGTRNNIALATADGS